MFGLGMPELLVILVVAVVVIGPKRLPDIARALGKGMREFRSATDDIKQSININPNTYDPGPALRKIQQAEQSPPETPDKNQPFAKTPQDIPAEPQEPTHPPQDVPVNPAASTPASQPGTDADDKPGT